MNTVIYLFNQEVQIVTGMPGKGNTTIKSVDKLLAPEGSIINGIVTDVENFTDFLRGIKNKYAIPSAGVTLVIGSSKFVGKNLDIPIMKDKETLNYIKREYTDMGRDAESVFGYIRMAGTERGMTKVYAEAIDPDFIGDYVTLFENAGIKLAGIYSSEGMLINYIAQKMLQEYKTFVMLVADAKNLATVVWVKGSYFYSNSVRSFHEKGTPEYAEDMGKSISKIMQFLQARQVEEKLHHVVIAGVEHEYVGMYQQAIRDVDNSLNVKPYRLAYEMQPYMFAISGLYGSTTKDNFLFQYQQYTKGLDKGKGGRSLIKDLIVPVAVLLVMLAIIAVLSIIKLGKQSELSKLESYNEDVMFDVLDYERYIVQNSALALKVRGTEGIAHNIITYPCGNTEVLDIIMKCAEGYAQIEYNQFSANAGSVSMTATSDNVEMINRFIKRLLEEKTFTKVDYTGYNYNAGNDNWNINVTCTLAESVGRPERAAIDKHNEAEGLGE